MNLLLLKQKPWYLYVQCCFAVRNMLLSILTWNLIVCKSELYIFMMWFSDFNLYSWYRWVTPMISAPEISQLPHYFSTDVGFYPKCLILVLKELQNEKIPFIWLVCFVVLQKISLNAGGESHYGGEGDWAVFLQISYTIWASAWTTRSFANVCVA